MWHKVRTKTISITTTTTTTISTTTTTTQIWFSHCLKTWRQKNVNKRSVCLIVDLCDLIFCHYGMSFSENLFFCCCFFPGEMFLIRSSGIEFLHNLCLTNKTKSIVECTIKHIFFTFLRTSLVLPIFLSLRYLTKPGACALRQGGHLTQHVKRIGYSPVTFQGQLGITPAKQTDTNG